MHTGTGIAVFARIVEEVEANIRVNFLVVAFPPFSSFASIPAFTSLPSITTGCQGNWVGTFGNIDNNGLVACAPPPRLFALVQ